MYDVIVERIIPDSESGDALHAALKSALGDKCTGFTARTGMNGVIRVHLTGDAKAEDDNTARQIVLKHDFSERTPVQLAQKARLEKLMEARLSVAVTKNTKTAKMIDVDKVAQLGALVDYLLLEIEYMRDRFGV